MYMILGVALLGLASATPPTWYTGGACGQSSYSDAGDKCPAGFGTCTGTRIAGGVEADPGEFPFMVSLRDRTTNEHICGGAIIAEEWILTSARCTEVLFAGDYDNIVVVVGEHLLDTVNASEANYDVSYAIPFEGFSYIAGSPTENDIAVLQLSANITMSPDVSPVCPSDPEVLYANQTGYTNMGWGADTRNGDPYNVLRYAGVSVFVDAFCSDEITSFTERMKCASDTGNAGVRDICEGDFGGPLVYKDPDGTFRVVGISSYELRCGDGYPGVYTDVSEPILNAWVTTKIIKS